MAQNTYNYHSTPHASPPPLTNNDYGGLMGSLISPGPGTPLQSTFPAPWPAQPGWQQNGGQGGYTYSMPYQGPPMNQTAWHANAQQAYIPQDDEDDELFTIDDTDILGPNKQQANGNAGISGSLRSPHNNQQTRTDQLHNHTLSSPLAQPQLQNATAGGPSQMTKSPAVNSAARAAELRAKLLANKSSNAASRQGSPAVKSNEQTDAKKTTVQELLRQTNGALATHSGVQAASEAMVQAREGNETKSVSTLAASDRSPGKTVTNMDFESLFAEAQNAANARKSEVGVKNRTQNNETNDMRSGVSKEIRRTEAATQNLQPALKKSISSSELSEPGEIHSETASPILAKQSARMAGTREAKQAKEDKKEKLMRQNEVKKAYQPLKGSRAPQSEPVADSWGKSPADSLASALTIKTNSEAADNLRRLPEPRMEPEASTKSQRLDSQQQLARPSSVLRGAEYEPSLMYEESRRDQHRDRTRDYDRRDDERFRRPLSSQQYTKEPDFRHNVEGRRQKLMDDNAKRTEENARRAAEYKKNLEAQRAPFRQTAPENSKSRGEGHKQEARAGPAQMSTINTSGKESSQNDNSMNSRNNEAGDGGQDPDTVMLSPGLLDVDGNQDLNDWLELTKFYDQEFREKRLGLFRKKRALELQQAELEREEQELQGIPFVARAQSTIPATSPPKISRRPSVVNPKMPPPPLPLKEANNDVGIKIKDSALSASLPSSQNTTPTLKRHHTEDDTELRRLQPAEKLARLDMNGHTTNEKVLTSPANVKGTNTHVKLESAPLENRISREDSDRFTARRRGRSRSPETRRRSVSPYRRRYLDDYSPEPQASFSRNHNGIARDSRTCHNCGQPGHYQHQCREPRRDGKDWTTSPGYQQWVSPNYRGRNPQSRPDTRSGEDRPRYTSVGKSDDGVMGNPRDNIGSRHLNLEAGGQYRR